MLWDKLIVVQTSEIFFYYFKPCIYTMLLFAVACVCARVRARVCACARVCVCTYGV